jgi:hypothetical protein
MVTISWGWVRFIDIQRPCNFLSSHLHKYNKKHGPLLELFHR